MLATSKRFQTLLLLIPLLATIAFGQDYVDDEDSNEVDARVARISNLVGDVSIKRIESEDWETVVENLPIVEGDTIHTERNSKLEIQLDRYSYLQLDGNSTLKFAFLGDDGIALSLLQGTLGIRLIQFDFDKGYLEVDAPRSTVAIQQNGSYRIDAGDEFNREVRVSVRDEGQARVYSRDSGFVLKDGRAARLFLDGDLEGEWETSRASALLDGFDSWMQDRNETIARRLAGDDDRDYYDEDIYGADDLDDYGQWSYTTSYGYLWQPYATSTARYADWSPYRYGQWRWLPYYGWTWVNDEPWGWATYHSGRWVFYNGTWHWSPYRRYGRGGSYWWRPALVFVTYVGNNYCWYPLPYGYGYYDYNRRFKKRWNRRPGRGRHVPRDDGNHVDRDTPTNPSRDRKTGLRNQVRPLGTVPEDGVVSIPAAAFGRARNGFERPSLGVAKQVLGQQIVADSSPLLPDLRDLNGKLGRDIKAPVPKTRVFKTDTGATTRKTAAPLDEKLRREKIYNNRTPMIRTSKEDTGDRTITRTQRTGAFERKRESKDPIEYSPAPVKETPIYRPRDRKTGDPEAERPTKSDPSPTYVPPTKQPDRKSPPPSRSNRPIERPSPPDRSAPRRSEPKRSPPIRSAPKQNAPDKKSPKPSEKPSRKGRPGGEIS